jgi:hypothetical protein
MDGWMDRVSYRGATSRLKKAKRAEKDRKRKRENETVKIKRFFFSALNQIC